MSETTGAKTRPLSPFMIGPYYRPQLTSMLSITHRMTGVFLWLGSLGLLYWLCTIAAGPDAYDGFRVCASSWFGQFVTLGLVWSLFFHFYNGVRHLFWDAGKGFEIPTAYASGWMVLILSLVSTATLILLGGVA